MSASPSAAALPWQRFTPLLIAALVALAVVWLPALRKPAPMPAADAAGYLTLAYPLHAHPVFTDPGHPPGEKPPPGDMVAPLYPGLLAQLMKLDPQFAERSACFLDAFYATPGTAALAGCNATLTPDHWGYALDLHRLLMAGALLMVWAAARLLSPHPVVPWLALGLAATSGVYGTYGQQFLTEALTLPLSSALALCLALAFHCPSTLHKARSLVGAAALCGIAALTRPTFSYVFYLLEASVLLTALFNRPLRRMCLRVCLPMAVIYFAAISPWMNRNDDLFGTFALTGSYGGYILAQRVAYNAMDLSQWLASFLFWLPDFGDSLAAVFFSPDVLRPLDWYAPDSFYVLGNGAWMQDYQQQAGGRDALLGWLLREKVLGDLATHLAVTLPLALRGLWVGKYFGLIGAVFWLSILLTALRHRAWMWLAYGAPALLLLGLQAFVSVSIPRYNLAVVPCMATAAAVILVHWAQQLPSRFAAPSSHESP
jgi:hypothetical protein